MNGLKKNEQEFTIIKSHVLNFRLIRCFLKSIIVILYNVRILYFTASYADFSTSLTPTTVSSYLPWSAFVTGKRYVRG